MNLRAGAVTIWIASAGLGLAGCSTTEVIQQGYVQDEGTLSLVSEGSSREQVLLALGTPSTKATFGDEVFYYISQTRQRTFAFQNPRVTQQRVLAIYFDGERTVQRVANYTLKDGKVFDTISRTTPTAGRDQTFLQQIIIGGLQGGPKSTPPKRRRGSPV